MDRKEKENLTENHTTPMFSEIQIKLSIELNVVFEEYCTMKELNRMILRKIVVWCKKKLMSCLL